MGKTLAKEQLFHNIDSGTEENVKYILLNYGELVNEYFDSENKSLPITRAAWLGNSKIVNMLILFGADVNKKVSNGYTAMFFAASKGHNKIIKKLLDTGVCVIDEVDNRGFTALDIAIN